MTESDAALVARVRRGDADAFETLVRRHFRSAYLVALARVGERADAEDVCQDALFRAWDRIGDCREPARFGAWLVRITRNTALNRREYLAIRTGEPLEETSARAPGGADYDLARGELRVRLDAALAQLTTAQREVVLLHDLEGWTHGEVAESLGMSEVMSRRHLSDARKRLRTQLGDLATLMPDHD